MITKANEIMAEALWVEQNRGTGGSAFIAERIGDLAGKGDMRGVARWKAIAFAYDQLRAGNMQ